jgi:hypothetical protein
MTLLLFALLWRAYAPKRHDRLPDDCAIRRDVGVRCEDLRPLSGRRAPIQFP